MLRRRRPLSITILISEASFRKSTLQPYPSEIRQFIVEELSSRDGRTKHF